MLCISEIIAEYNGSGTLLRKFIYGPGIDEPICMIVVNGETETKYYYHFDGAGSVVALSDSNADIVEQYTYDVFGQPSAASSVGNPYLFTGRRYDNETGLYYYRARYYDYYIGRFIQPDPIGYDDGLNLYTYVGNNPVMYVDPYGLWQFTFGGAFGLGGRITFGQNNGRWNVGFAFGYGIGAMVEFTPDDIDSGSATEGLSANIGGEVSGSAKVYSTNVSGGLRFTTQADSSDNIRTRTGLIGGLTAPGTEVLNLSGSLDIVTQGNINRGTFNIFPERVINKPSYGLGAMAFGGVTGGVEWGHKCKK
jgi:RHS repeat-associated protein